MKLATAAQMREIDRRAIEELKIPEGDLLEAAGRAVAMDVAEHFEKGTVAILCGKGNNAADGLVAARYLKKAGWAVHLISAVESKDYGGACRTAWDTVFGSVHCQLWRDMADPVEFLSGMDVVIDALLGTGTKGRPRPPYDAIITALNAARVPVVSIDIPSGLDPDTGAAECAVKAFRTVTIGLPKVGFVTGRGAEYTGAIRVEPINFPRELLESAATNRNTLMMSEARLLLPPRPVDGNKGTFGLCVIAAGSESMPGAAVLSGYGALRGGCGLVRMHTPRSIRNIIALHLPEVLLSKVAAGETHLEAVGEKIDELMEKAASIAIGPGIGKAPETREFLREILKQNIPTVIDADALNIIAEDDELRALLGENHLLTPHPGELARLLGMTTKDIQEDRWSAAERAAKELNCVVLVKGEGTLVAEPGGAVTHIGAGNTAWARGGAGDVLTGLIGSLLAQGMRPAEAAKLGAFVHGMAADIFVKSHSPRGGLTREVADRIADAFTALEGR